MGLTKPKLLKGICKSQLENDLEDEEVEEGEEGEEEDGFSDDEIVDPSGKGSGTSSSNPSPIPKTTPPKNASNDTAASVGPTPCRRFSRKGSVEMDEIQIISTGKSRERLELDQLLKKIAALELSKWGP